MSLSPIDTSRENPLPRGVPFAISADDAAAHWPIIAGALQTLDAWSQYLSPEEIRTAITDRRIQPWAVIDHSERLALGFTFVQVTSRGSICRFWLACPMTTDDLAIAALTDEIDCWARSQGCAILEIYAPPGFQSKLQAVRQASVVLERDLRGPLSVRAN